jgi:hypothetical protein
MVEDITSESLAVLLQNRGECLASISADAGVIFNVLLGRYGKKDRTDDNIYLKAFSGDLCRVNRQGRGRVVLKLPCLAALWLTQPDKVDSLLKVRSLSTGGFLPRFLVCHTGAKAQPIPENAVRISPDTANAWTQIVRGLLHTFRGASRPLTFAPVRGAQQALDEHCNSIVERRKNELRDIGLFAARRNEQTWRIAVCLHAGICGDEAAGHSLGVETAEKAIKLADWFATCQMEILAGKQSEPRRPEFEQALALLVDTPEGIRASDIYRKRIVSPAKEAHSLLKRMEAEGELLSRSEKPEGGGHISRIYTVARK